MPGFERRGNAHNAGLHPHRLRSAMRVGASLKNKDGARRHGVPCSSMHLAYKSFARLVGVMPVVVRKFQEHADQVGLVRVGDKLEAAALLDFSHGIGFDALLVSGSIPLRTADHLHHQRKSLSGKHFLRHGGIIELGPPVVGLSSAPFGEDW